MSTPSRDTDHPEGSVLAVCGGIGGAKLALGLYHALRPGELVVAVNTGDDFEHLGLNISPDIDTVLYTLSGLSDSVRGWGRMDETWNFMAALEQLGGAAWFQLGDRDLAMHVERTRMLRATKTLSEFVAHAARKFGINAQILPATDDPLQTFVSTDEGELPFQVYFVERAARPRVRGLRFARAERARPVAKLLKVLASTKLRAVVICPSNPYLSIDPMLAMPKLRDAIATSSAPVIAVSPIIGGRAIKGPTAKIMVELGVPVTNQSIAEHYRGLIDGLVIDVADKDATHGISLPVLATRTLMENLADRKRLAAEVIGFAEEVVSRHSDFIARRARAGVPA